MKKVTVKEKEVNALKDCHIKNLSFLVWVFNVVLTTIILLVQFFRLKLIFLYLTQF